MSLDELFAEFKKVPDWERFPMPDVFYETFKVKKPQPANLNDIVCYQPPPHLPLGEGKTEERGPAEGGVRTIELTPSIPVDVKRLNEQTQALEDYPPPDLTQLHTLKMNEAIANNDPSAFNALFLQQKLPFKVMFKDDINIPEAKIHCISDIYDGMIIVRTDDETTQDSAQSS